MHPRRPQDRAFDAIADPVRRALLDRMLGQERSVTELRSGFGISQPAISQHLRVLREAGLVSERRDGRRRLYSAKPQGLRGVADWLARYERFWEGRLDELGRFLDRDRS